MLDENQGKGQAVGEIQSAMINSGQLSTQILKVEPHRMCTVAYCLQFNQTTSDLRYLVYGTKWNGDSSYGIGVTLETVDVEKYFPLDDDTAKFIS